MGERQGQHRQGVHHLITGLHSLRVLCKNCKIVQSCDSYTPVHFNAPIASTSALVATITVSLYATLIPIVLNILNAIHIGTLIATIG